MKSSEAVIYAINEIGIKEYPAGSNDVKYNTWYYGKPVMGNNYPWCCAFISWLFRNDRDLCKRTASCQDLLEWFEKSGCIVKTPKAGDIVFFKYLTNNRRTNHVGIVIDVKGSQIVTVEGNTSVTSQDNGGAVMQRTRTSNIVAYARPCYDDAWITVKKGTKGVFVKKLQHILNVKYGLHLKEDGDAGELTVQGIITAQALLGIEKDGIAGRDTWTKLGI